jgi:SAM-dependent methyltransferase
MIVGRMASSKEHYERVLAPVYSWMYGGFAAALERNREFFERHGIASPQQSGIAVDLGAGCGFQSIPLAELGYAVTAVDIDSTLLSELRAEACDLPIRTVEADLRDFRSHVGDPAELVVCMTDTILHLESADDVRSLCAEVHSALERGGRFIVTFRDLTAELAGLDRFIPVRSDPDTIFTCFLEYEPYTVKVHDLVYRREDEGWQFSKSYYRKLRMSADWLCEQLSATGFDRVEVESLKGLVTVVAARTR